MIVRKNPALQSGLGLVGAVFIFGLIAFVAVVTIKTLPLYLNQMKVARAVNGIVLDPELAGAEAVVLRDRLQRRWDIEDIQTITPQDIKVRRDESGRALVYNYEARTHLFYNVDLVLHFADEVPLPAAVQ